MEDFIISNMQKRRDLLLSNLKKIFSKMDSDKDGTLSYGEFKYWMQKYDPTITEGMVRIAMSSNNTTNSNKKNVDYMTYDDFVALITRDLPY